MLLLVLVATAGMTVCVDSAGAQSLRASNENDDLPDAPMPKQDPADAAPEPQQKQQTPLKEAMGVLGSRSVFFPELAHDKGPLSSRQKLELAVDETITPSRFAGSAFTSAIGQAGIFGGLMAEGLANSYLPDGERTAGKRSVVVEFASASGHWTTW